MSSWQTAIQFSALRLPTTLTAIVVHQDNCGRSLSFVHPFYTFSFHQSLMAAALQPLHSESTPASLYSRAIMTEFEFGENRYPSAKPHTSLNSTQRSRPATANRPWQQPTSNSDDQQFMSSPESLKRSLPWQQTGDQQMPSRTSSLKQQTIPEFQSGPYDQTQQISRTPVSYNLPPGAARWAVERFNLDDSTQRSQSKASNEHTQAYVDSQSIQETVIPRTLPRPMASSHVNQPTGRASPSPSLDRRSPLQNSRTPLQDGHIPSMIPFSASPAYSPPVAPNPRAFAHQPTFVNGNSTKPIQPVYTPIVPQQEDVCVECAMRDQDMVDVDVTSPGVWERASDAVFEELKRKEIEEEFTGSVSTDSARPRIKGGRLTERNLKLWLSINPREPASKHQTLTTYIRSQRALLEAEATAHARAMQEARVLDSRVRDAYAGARMSAYTVGGIASPIDDLGGVRIRPPTMPAKHGRNQSREVTLLENGMIIEHVDIRKEEKEAREKRRKDEKRFRKSSRSSAMDVNSIISQSSGQLVDGAFRPSPRLSQSHSLRPMSVFSKSDRIDLPRAHSQLSFSDAQSLGSASPRRTRFFGIKNLNGGWRSQDSLAQSGMSGSMVDMHVALQRDSARHPRHVDLNTPHGSQIWPPVDLGEVSLSQVVLQHNKSKKKIGGLAKIWRKVTGKTDIVEQDDKIQYDDAPLPLPPSLSYLIERKPPNDFTSSLGNRHGSTPSLHSISSPKVLVGQLPPGMSPPSAPSSMLPSPVALQPYVEVEIADGRQTIYSDSHSIRQEDSSRHRTMQSFVSDPDLRYQNPQNSSISKASAIPSRVTPLLRDKTLPPIPVGESSAQVLSSDRPKTFYALETTPKIGSRDLVPPEASFRVADRPQSFGGMTSRPNLGVPIIKPVDFDTFGRRYDEFGSSRRSLGVLDQEIKTSQPSKRKSKFGLNTLLGKKSDKHEQDLYDNQLVAGLPYDVTDDMTTTGYATSLSRHSALSSNATNLRMSTYGRRPLEELVQQDAEFLAYRYPSADQQLDILR